MGTVSSGWRRLALLSSVAFGWGGHAFGEPMTHDAAPSAPDLPQGGSVAAGSASIGTPQDGYLVINQQSQSAIINWASFNIGAQGSVHFEQPSITAAVLNRVTGDTPSALAGSLTATGSVFLVNPNGIGIAPGAIINTGSFAASTLDIADADFLSGTLTFRSTGRNSVVSNDGAIQVRPGGQVALIGSSVVNHGAIEARLGSVTLAAGDLVTLDFGGDGFLSVSASESELAEALGISRSALRSLAEQGINVVLQQQFAENAMLSAVNVPAGMRASAIVADGFGRIVLEGGEGYVDQSGTISARGGDVYVGANALVSLTGSINTSGSAGGAIRISGDNVIAAGLLDVSGTRHAGSIEVEAGGRFIATTAASMLANGPSGGAVSVDSGDGIFFSGVIETVGSQGRGGEIGLGGDAINLIGAHLDASGARGGGSIRAGFSGDLDAPQINALSLDVAPSTTLRADATSYGDGGIVALWSQDATNAFASISARGGALGGDGGFIEISSRGDVSAGGAIDASAPMGERGVFLLDPKTIIIDDVAGVFPQYQLVNPNPTASDLFGASVTPLSTGAVVVTATGDDVGAANAGAVYVFDRVTGALISALVGSTPGDAIGGSVVQLANGNFVIVSTLWDGPGATTAGAVTFGSGLSGVSGIVSAANSLVGLTANSSVGSGGITALSSGDYVVASPSWDLGGLGDVGAATWGSGLTGVSGGVSAVNSLVGSLANSQVSSGGIVALANGNYVVVSPIWDAAAGAANQNFGAVTWGLGTAGVSGAVSSVNSLVGAIANSNVGGGGVTALTNGNYAVASPNWDAATGAANSNFGAATWGSGAGGLVGLVSAANSLVGSLQNNSVGSGGITALSNGNYVVASPNWDLAGTANVGAATLGSGLGGLIGAVSAANSLVGANVGDNVSSGGITALTNGNYVVASPAWRNGAATVAGAATWGSGTTGVVGAVSLANSLVGTITNSSVSSGGVRALANGNYVVISPVWDTLGAADAGAVTWGLGTAGVAGAVSSVNSLVGSTASDSVGNGGVTVLSTTGAYVVRSTLWDGVASNVGAATFGSAASGVSGVVSAANSLVGSTADDNIGSAGVVALSNGAYVVASPLWNNGGTNNAGAVTYGSASTGVSGAASALNSLVGTSGGDQVGSSGVAALTNGNYVVRSPNWDGSANNIGAATWGSGATGIVGAVSAVNSLVGSTAQDQVADGGVVALANGDYLVLSFQWDNGVLGSAGAATWGPGAVGVSGAVSAVNSIVGATAGAGGTLGAANSSTLDFIYRNGGEGVGGRVAVGLTDPNAMTFERAESQTITIRTGFLTRTLNTGTAVTLQANTDIVLNSNLSVANPLGSGGDLSLQAGRSILLNANIVTDNGNLTLVANDRVANGVISTYRDPGAATITMAPGTSINAGSGNVRLTVSDGFTGGDLDLRAITAGSVIGENFGLGDIRLNGIVSAGAGATPIVLGALNGDFINLFGAGALNPGAGRFLVYSQNPANDTKGGLVAAPWYNTVYNPADPDGSVPGASRFVYTFAPSLTVTANDDDRIYGDPDPVFGYAITGLVPGDLLVNAVLGAPSIATNASASSIVGDYSIIPTLGTLTSPYNYGFGPFVNATLTINPRPITVSATQPAGKTYGDPDTPLGYSFTSGNLVFADTLSGALARDPGQDVGIYNIVQGTLAATSNYDLTFVGGVFQITQRAIQVTANPGQTRVYGNSDPTLTYSITNGTLAFTDVFSGALARDPGENVGFYAINQGSLIAGPNSGLNYNLTFIGDQFEITQRPITVSATLPAGKTYGDADPALAYSITLGNLVFLDALTGALTRDTGEDVGLYPINQGSVTAGPNYALTFVGGNFQISQRPIEVTADPGQSRVYGETDPAFTYTITDGSLAFTDVFSGALTRVAGENVDLYDILQGTFTAGSNYNLSFISNPFEITQRPITVSAAQPAGKTYGNADPLLDYDVTLGNLVFSDAFTGALTRDAGENVGVYDILQGTLSAGSNYALTFIGGDFQISQRDLEVTANPGQARVYGDGDPIFAYTITDGSLAFTDTFSGALTRIGGEDVGLYDILQGTLTAGSNYNLSFIGDQFEITQRPITVSATLPAGKTYGDADPAIAHSITAGTLVFSDALTGALTRDVGENVGSYDILQGSVTAGGNYAITFVGGDFVISQRLLEVTANPGQSRVYGEADSTLTYTITDGSLAFSDAFTGALSRISGEDVGFYDILQGTLTAGSNYDLSFIGDQFEITQRPITVSATNQARLYGDADPTLTYTITTGSLAFSDVLGGALERDPGEDVGPYAITQGSLADSNYLITFNDGVFTIDPRPITVTADPQSRIYGDPDPALTAQVTLGNLVFGDTLAGALARAAGSDVGNYAITQGTLSASSNYDLTFVDGVFTIQPRPITVTADDFAKVYGEIDPALTAQLTSGSLVAGDSITGDPTRAAGEDAGAYAIGQGTVTAGANYVVTFVDGVFTIQPRPITVTADDLAKVYGALDPALTAQLTNGSLVAGDSITGAPTRVAGENAAAYAIGQGSLTAGPNYTVTFVDGVFTIQPRAITITADDLSKIYGAADPALTAHVTSGSLVAGDSLSGALSRAAGENAGAYSVGQGTLTAGANYTVSFVNGVFTIQPRPITVTADDLSKILGQPDPTLTYTLTQGSLVTGDAISGLLARAPGESVGEYAINVGGLSAGSNYALTFIDGVFAITPLIDGVGASQTQPGASAVTGPTDATGAFTGPSGIVTPGTGAGLAETASDFDDNGEECLESAEGVCVVGP